VDFHIPCPYGITDPQPCVEKVRTCIPVLGSSFNYLDFLPISGKQAIAMESLKAPNVL
jgi:hypothetical protein